MRPGVGAGPWRLAGTEPPVSREGNSPEENAIMDKIEAAARAWRKAMDASIDKMILEVLTGNRP